MSAIATSYGGVFVGETGQRSGSVLGAFLTERAGGPGDLAGVVAGIAQVGTADLTVLNNRLIATYSPNVTGSPYTGQYGYRFQLAATTAFNRVGLYAAAGDLVQTVKLYDWNNIAGGPIATWAIDLTGLGVGVYGWINIPGGITLTAGVTYFLGRTVTAGNGQNWPDQKATTLNGAVGGSVFSCFLDISNAPTTSTANFQYGGIDLNRVDSFGSLGQTQSQTLAAAGTVAGSGAWTPAALPGLVAWYDVQDASTVTTSGGFVTQLNDKGPNGYHASQATAGAQPTLVSAAINGHPALNFDPSVTIQHLEAIGLPPPLTLFPNGFALYFVSAEQDSGAYGYQVASPLHYSTYNVPEPFGRRDSLMFIGNGSDFQGGFDTYSVMTGNAPAYWGYRYLTSTDTFEDWLNGTQVSTWVANAYPTYYGGNSSDFQIGRRNSLDTVVTGYVGEIIVCNALVESDRLKLEAYLSAKWFGAPPTGITGTLAVTQADQTISAVANISIGGTLNASQSQALSALAKVTVGGALSVTQANQTISASGGVTAGATLALAQAPHSLVAAAKTTVGGALNASQSQTLIGAGTVLTGATGALNVLQANQTIVAVGNTPNVATLAVTQANQTISGLAKATVGASLSLPQAPQTLSGAAGPVVKGALAYTQPDQTIAASGALKVTGTLSVSQQPQTLVGAGIAASPDCIGTLRLTQADQTINGHATVAGTIGALSVTQADQTLGALARVVVGGALNTVQAAHTLSGAARANIGGTLTATQADQTLVGQGGTNILAALNQTQGNQTLVGRIDTTGGAILDKLQDSQILVGAAKLTVGASLDLTQASQTLTGLLSIAAGGSLRITQDNQTFEGLANLAIAGRLVAYQQPQTLIAHDQPGTAIQTQARVMVMA